MTDPTIGLGDRLARLLPPAAADGPATQVLGHYDLLHARLDRQLQLVDAIRLRFPLLPEPPARQSLQELVQAGRRALRTGRADADVTELHARRALVDRIRAGLQP
ncbi:hypothetical protein [Micromonospora sp. CB01531]|uniref:hypothetical protein n=1 Tax=Micromonospora sp. CB01531 TaxID=1718947 RepID=UPI00093B5123|nr:hypothetical protein [Micromonospora sp. CB01531]OKI51401.1 hypothetical protein A6A27_33545 [Micromonospora sp. CB01531]